MSGPYDTDLTGPGVRALLVGTRTHRPDSALPTVDAVDRTVAALADVLVEKCGMDPDGIRTIIDPESPDVVVDALEAQVKEATRVLILYYVGHAIVPNGALHLATYGTRGLDDRVRSLAFSEVREQFDRSGAACRVIVLDCCHSARAGDDERTAFARDPVIPAIGGTYLLASAARDEHALAPVGQEYTGFSGELIRYLTVGDPRSGPVLNLDSAYAHLRRVLPERGMPVPHRRHSDTAASLVLARNPIAVSVRPSPHGPEPAAHTGDDCPYLGLGAFSTDDAVWFHGRSRAIATLVARVRERLVDPRPLVVTGASGTGKSSLLRAGLIPALARGDVASSHAWPPACVITPGLHPLRSLAAPLARMAGESTEAVGAALAADPASIRSVIARGTAAWSRDPAGPEKRTTIRTVIVVDQFEAVFAHADPRERRAFISALDHAARPFGPGVPPALVVLAVRADYLSEFLDHPETADAMRSEPFFIEPMTSEELREAIVEPARLAGLELEVGLLDRLLDDIWAGLPGDQPQGGFRPDCLPLLSHALQNTWHRREGRVLTLAGYHATGGISGAIGRTAEKIYDRFSYEEKDVCRRMMPRLIHINDSRRGTRRTVPRSDLLAGRDPVDTGRRRRVLEALVDARLVTVDHDDVELTHEAVIDRWPLLRSWVSEGLGDYLIRQEVNLHAETWERSGRKPDHVDTGAHLARMKQWAAEGAHREELSPRERDFLNASLRHERRRTLRRRLTRSGAVVAALVLAGVGVFAGAVNGQRLQAVSRLVSVQADQLRTSEPELSMLLSLAAYRIADTPEARSSLINASTVTPAVRLPGTEGAVLEAGAIDTRHGVLATGGNGREIDLWDIRDIRDPRPLASSLTGPEETVYGLAYRRDGTLLAAGGGDRVVHLWDTGDPASPRRLPSLSGPENTVYAVAFGAGGDLLAAASADTNVYVWDVSDEEDPRLAAVLRGHAAEVHALAFQNEGRVLATGGEHVRLWDLSDPGAPEPLVTHLEGSGGGVQSVAFSQEGSLLAAGTREGGARFWDVTEIGSPRSWGEGFSVEEGVTGHVKTIAFNSSGTRVAVGTSDRTVLVWDTATRHRVGTYVHPGPVTSVRFSEGDEALMTTASDGTARLWPLQGPVLRAIGDRLYALAFSPDGDLLVTAGTAGIVYIWDRSDPYSPRLAKRLDAFGDYVASVSFSPDGGLLAAASVDSTIRVWDMDDPSSPEEVAVFADGAEGGTEVLEFSPDGRLLATGSNDHAVRLWDIADPHDPRPLGQPLTEPENEVWSLSFSPGGDVLAAGSISGVVHLWDVSDTGAPRARAELDTDDTSYVFGIDFSSDGDTLAVARGNGEVELWDTTDSAAPLRVESPLLTGFGSAVQSVAFNTEGTTLAVGLADHTSRIWDVTDPAQPQDPVIARGPENTVWAVDFSPDGVSFASANLDGTVRVWDTDLERVTDYICTTTGGHLSRSEWERYVPDVDHRELC
ncbi:caspase, EACC1-associated type [Nocardiopsis flavescens]